MLFRSNGYHCDYDRCGDVVCHGVDSAAVCVEVLRRAVADPNKFRKFVVIFLQRVAVVEVLRSYGILCRNGRGRFDQDIDNDNCILHAE